MRVNILFFGATAAAIGQRRVEMSVEGDDSASAVFEKVLEKFPDLSSHRLLFSVNQEYVSSDTRIRDGDELAVFTAVSGG